MEEAHGLSETKPVHDLKGSGGSFTDERLRELGLPGDKDGEENVISVWKALMAGNEDEESQLFSAVRM